VAEPVPAGLFGAEPIILERLRAVLDRSVQVLAAPSLDAVLAGTQPPRAVYVMWRGAAVQTPERTDGRATRITARWMVLITVGNAAQSDTGAPARAAAGALVDAVLDALMGFRPDGPGSAPLVLTDLPNPGYIKGYQWVPIVFSHTLTHRVSPTATPYI